MLFNEMVNSGYFGYMSEKEGMVSINSSRATKINAIIKTFKSLVNKGKNPNNYISEVLASYGFSEDDLTESEISKINREINKIYHG